MEPLRSDCIMEMSSWKIAEKCVLEVSISQEGQVLITKIQSILHFLSKTCQLLTRDKTVWGLSINIPWS